MSSVYSSLSTTLACKSSSSPPEEDPKRGRKVSLIAAADLDDEEYKWRNRFEGVSQYKPPSSEDSSLSDSSQAATCKYLDTSSSLPSHAQEQNIASRNGGGVYTSAEDERRRSGLEWVEPAAPDREGAPLWLKSLWHPSACDNTSEEEDDDASRFTGVFQATLVELDSDPVALPSTPPASPDLDSPSQFDMDNLVDTLKSMGPSMRPRAGAPRPPAPALMSSLPPIVEDTHSPACVDVPDIAGAANTTEPVEQNPGESLNGLYTLPPDLGLRSTRNTRSVLDLMKQNQQVEMFFLLDLIPSLICSILDCGVLSTRVSCFDEWICGSPIHSLGLETCIKQQKCAFPLQEQTATRGPGSPVRTTNGTVTRTSSDSFPDDVQAQILNGNGLLPSPSLSSRLDNSVIFGRSATSDQKLENKAGHRSVFRTSSLPDAPFGSERLSMGAKELESGTRTDPVGSRYERFSFLLNTSTSGSLNGEDAASRISRAPLANTVSLPSGNSPTRLLNPTGSLDLHRPFAPPESTLAMFGQTQAMGVGAGRVSAPILQRSFSAEGGLGVPQTSLFSSVPAEAAFKSQEPQSDRNLPSKYRAFPDAYVSRSFYCPPVNTSPMIMKITGEKAEASSTT